MLLTATTDKLSLITSVTCDLDVVVAFVERNQTTGAVGAASRQLTTIATATTTDILGAPGSTTDRQVSRASIRNTHASTAVDIVVQYNANGVLYEMWGARLFFGDKAEYDSETGWVLYTRKPRLRDWKVSPQRSTTNAGVSATAIVTVFDLCVPIPRTAPNDVTQRVFGYFCSLVYSTAISTTGFQPTAFVANNQGGLSPDQCTTILVATLSVTGAALTAGNSNSGTPIAQGTSPASAALAGGFMAGGMKESASLGGKVNTIIVQFSSEVAASQVQAEVGSWIEVFEATG